MDLWRKCKILTPDLEPIVPNMCPYWERGRDAENNFIVVAFVPMGYRIQYFWPKTLQVMESESAYERPVFTQDLPKPDWYQP